MKRRRQGLGHPLTNNYQKIADLAQEEMRRAVRRDDPMAGRQAVNKAYLAVVHAARTIVDSSELKERGGKSARSTRDIGRVATLLGQRRLRDRQTDEVLLAFHKAAGQHSVCFYDGFCIMSEMASTVRLVRKAMKHVPHTCDRVRNQGGGDAET